MKFLKSLIEKLENIPLTFWQGMLLIYISSFFRVFLENFSNDNRLGAMNGLTDTFFAIPIWYFALSLAMFVILRILTREKIEKISRLGAILSFSALAPTLIDLIVNKGRTVSYNMITGNFPGLLKSFFSFAKEIPGVVSGGTNGLRIEVFLGMLCIAGYVFLKTRKWGRTILGALLFYLVVFIFASSTSLAFIAKNAVIDRQPVNIQTIHDFYYLEEPLNAATNFNHRTFIVEENDYFPAPIRKISNQYSITLAIMWFGSAVFFLAWWFWLYDRHKFLAVIKNFPLGKIISCFFMIGLGVILGISFSGLNPIKSMFDLLSFVSLFIAILFAGLFSVWENDEVDIEIDKIVHPERPLPKKEFSIKEWRVIKYLFLFISLNFAFLLGFYPFIFILLFLVINYIYSAPPLRLKRFLGLSSLLVAAINLIYVWLGFFWASETENLRDFPSKYIFGILAIVFLIEHIRNIKDIWGDKKGDVRTIPVVFGEKKGKLIIGILTFLGLLLIPIVFYLKFYAFLTAILFGSIMFFLINKKNYQEKYVYAAYAVFIVVFILETLTF